MPKKTSKYGIPDADSPEWTREDFKQAKRLSEMPEDFQRFFSRKGRGPQKTPTKTLISLRVSREVVDAMKATGRGWQTRANEALRRTFLG
jgi:uncharacterized protein (DUF4415 family)